GGLAGTWESRWPAVQNRKEPLMRPAFYSLPCLLPLALAAATLSLLAPTDLAPLTDPELLKALDPSGEEELWRAQRRWEDKRHVTGALLDGRLTLRQPTARFRDIDADRPDRARHWRPPQWTDDAGAYRQVSAFVVGELAGRRQAPALAQEWVSRLEAELGGDRPPEGASPPPAPPGPNRTEGRCPVPLNEADTRAKLIDPALHARGWTED